MSDNTIMIKQSNQILKNLKAVLDFSVERYRNQFIWQEIELTPEFMQSFGDYLKKTKKGMSISFFKHTSIVTNRSDQNIFIANQWFAIGSFFVDFCTELLTYQDYFEKICYRFHITGKEIQQYAILLKSDPSEVDKNIFCSTAYDIFKSEFDYEDDTIRTAVSYLWKFVNDYSWWAGQKYVSRKDFFISPILNSLGVVNANAEFLAYIVLHYASNLNLRLMVESLDGFTIGTRINRYKPSDVELRSYNEAEQTVVKDPICDYDSNRISISAASLQRFKSSTI